MGRRVVGDLAARAQDGVKREDILASGHDEEKQKERQARNDVFVKRIQRLFEEMAKRHHQHDAQSE